MSLRCFSFTQILFLFFSRERWKMFVNLSYIHRKRETNKSAHLTEWPCTATWHHLFVTLKYDNDICWWLILTLNENRPHWLAGLRSLTHSFTERYRMRGGVREEENSQYNDIQFHFNLSFLSAYTPSFLACLTSL